MELVEDIKKIIVQKLKKDTITLLNREYRHLYFVKNGIKIRDIRYLVGNKSYLLEDYPLKIKIKSYEWYYLYNNKIPTEILNNIISIGSIDMSDKYFTQIINSLKYIHGLKYISFRWENSNIYKLYDANIAYLSDKVIKITINIPQLSQGVIDFIDSFPENNRPTIELCNFGGVVTNPYLDKISKYVRRLRYNHCMSNLNGVNFPKLEKLMISDKFLVGYKNLLPNLLKIIWMCLEISDVDKRLEKYSGVRQKFNKVSYIGYWSKIDIKMYKKIRKYYFDNDPIKLYNDVKELSIIEKLETEYRTRYGNVENIDYHIYRKIFEKYLSECNNSKFGEYFNIYFY